MRECRRNFNLRFAIGKGNTQGYDTRTCQNQKFSSLHKALDENT
jgi:hypothetical protein